MTSKYSNLPDIDTAADIYETEEIVASGSGSKDYNSDDDFLPSTSTPTKLPPGTEINSSKLPTREQLSGVFGKRSREMRGVREKKGKDGSITLTYRPRLPPVPRSLRPTSASYSSHPGPSSSSASSDEDDPLAENPTARLRRLRCEMDELERELLKSQLQVSEVKDENAMVKKGRKEPSASEMLEELSGMKTGLQRISDLPGSGAGLEKQDDQGSDLLAKLEKLGLGKGAEPGQTAVQASGAKAIGSVSEVDKRLEVLESTIGAGSGADETSLSQPILPTLQRLEQLLSILAQPRQLDSISRRIKVLLADLDKAASSSSGSNVAKRAPISATSTDPADGDLTSKISPADLNKLDSLFGLIPRIDPLLPILPPLLMRLRSLSHLHASSSTFLSTLERLESESTQIAEGEKELKGVLERVEAGLGEMGEGVKENWKGLEERLGEVDKRLKALSGSG